LRDSERELSQLINMVPILLWRLTPDGRCTFFNKRLTDFFGRDEASFDKPGRSQLEVAIDEVVHPEDKVSFGAEFNRCFGAGERFSMMYRVRRSDGVYRWVDGRIEPMRGEDGRILQWYGLALDIDDQMRLYSELQEREAKIRRLVDSDIIGIVIWDLDGRLIDANDAFLRIVQYEREDLQVGLRWFDMTPPEWQDVHAHEEAEELKTTGVIQAREKEFFRKDGSRVPVLIGAGYFEGQSRQGVAYILDLTERKRAEAALRDRERELSQLVDMAPVHIRRMSPKGETIFLNKRLVDFAGVDLADLREHGMSGLAAATATVLHPDDAAGFAEALNHSLVTGEPFFRKYRLRRADGAYRWMEGRAEPVRDQSGAIVQWYGISIDIDDEMRAQEALRDREQELSQLVNMVPVLIRRMTPQGEPTFFNKRLLDFFGFEDVSELDKPGMSRLAAAIQTLVHPDEAAGILETVRGCFASGEPFSMKYRMRRADGVYRWVDTRGEPLRNPSGAIVQWYVISLDIDDEMRAQEAIRQSERRLQQMIDAVPVHILSFTPAGEPAYINKRYRDYLGLSVPHFDSLREQQRALIHPEDFAEMYGTLKNCFETGAPFLMRYRRRGKDGTYRWTEGRAEPLRDQDGKIVQWYAVSLDIEDETRAQEALRQASAKLAQATQAASLAELSASIAHEVNQPLAAIVANSHACQRWLSAEPANVERAKITVERIIRDANSAADVVAHIRALFKQSVEPRSSTPLSGAITEARSLMAEEAARRRVRMDIDVESNLPLVAFDRVQIQQVLINLIRNGFDAMDSTPDDRVLGLRARRVGSSIQIEISDRGQGIEFPDKIFEPFFTTKQNGMGMGLAICRSIVESHGGRLWAEKNEPRGAALIFTLPIEMKPAS
jgi:PAS domain S-box-containing protein